MTSAPWSARIIVAHGPDSIEERSTTRMPASGPMLLLLQWLRGGRRLTTGPAGRASPWIKVRLARVLGKSSLRMPGSPALLRPGAHNVWVSIMEKVETLTALEKSSSTTTQ
jgi:hypothetical protein